MHAQSGHTAVAAKAPVGIGWRHPHYRELLAIRPQVDFLEVHSENFFSEGGAALTLLMQARAHYPVSLHGVGLSLGSAAGVDEWHLDQLERLVLKVEPALVSDHACFARGMLGDHLVHAADLLPIPFSQSSLDVLCSNIQHVQDRLRRTLVLENLSAYIGWNSRPGETEIHESEFLCTVALRTGCQLLVDVNNLYVNACNAKLLGAAGDSVQTCLEWLSAIPAELVGEIHLAGHLHVNDEHGEIVIDDHGRAVCSEVWSIYRHAVARFGSKPTLIEWDTHIPALSRLLSEAETAKAINIAAHVVADQYP